MTPALRERVKAVIIAKLGAPKDFYAGILYEQAVDAALSECATALRERANECEEFRRQALAVRNMDEAIVQECQTVALRAAADMMEQKP